MSLNTEVKVEPEWTEQTDMDWEQPVKEEPVWQDGDTGLRDGTWDCAVLNSTDAEEASRSGLYAAHEVKQELVLGPEQLQPPDKLFSPPDLRTKLLMGYLPHTFRLPVVIPPCNDTHSADLGTCDWTAEPTDSDRPRNNSEQSTQTVIPPATYTKFKRFSCHTCLQRFSLLSELNEHKTTHTKIIGKGMKFKRKSRYTQTDWEPPGQDSPELLTQRPGHSCHVCERQFSLRSEFNQHKKTHKRVKRKRLKYTRKKHKSAKLNLPKKQMDCQRSLENSPEQYTQPSFSCHKCQQRFSLRFELYAHMTNIHKKKPPVNLEKNPPLNQRKAKPEKTKRFKNVRYTCAMCETHFATIASFKAHALNLHPHAKVTRVQSEDNINVIKLERSDPTLIEINKNSDYMPLANKLDTDPDNPGNSNLIHRSDLESTDLMRLDKEEQNSDVKKFVIIKPNHFNDELENKLKMNTKKCNKIVKNEVKVKTITERKLTKSKESNLKKIKNELDSVLSKLEIDPADAMYGVSHYVPAAGRTVGKHLRDHNYYRAAPDKQWA